MNKPAEFFKTTILGGAIVIVPVVLVLLVLIETVDLVGSITDPIVEQLPIETVGGIEIASILAILIILGACFLAGLAARSKAVAELGRRFENAVLDKMPMYQLIKTVTRSFSPSDPRQDQVKPAVLTLPDQSLTLVVIIEEHANGHATIFVPRAPMPTMGDVMYVACERLTPVDAPLGEVVNVIMQWGYGAGALFDPKLKAE